MAQGFKTGGRKPGSKNKRTAKLQAAVESAAKVIGGFEGDAHTLLMAVYKSEAYSIDVRIDAAKAAIRFEKPALASLEAKSEVVHRFVARIPNKAENPDKWQQQHAPTPPLQ